MIELQKKRLREVFKKQRAALTQEEVTKKSQEICQNFIANLLPKIYPDFNQEISKQVHDQRKIFSLYLSTSNEPSCNAIAQLFQQNQIPFSYPKIIQKCQPLEFILTASKQDFTFNDIYPNILEPVAGTKVLPDFLILPLLAFDDALVRLGMGGGFFDRSISQLRIEKPQIITIALAYDFQRARDQLPLENTDQKLDFIVTEKNIFLRS